MTWSETGSNAGVAHVSSKRVTRTNNTPALLSCLVCQARLQPHRRTHPHWSNCWAPPEIKSVGQQSVMWQVYKKQTPPGATKGWCNSISPHSPGLRSVTFSSVHAQQTCRHLLPSSFSPAPGNRTKRGVYRWAIRGQKMWATSFFFNSSKYDTAFNPFLAEMSKFEGGPVWHLSIESRGCVTTTTRGRAEGWMHFETWF